MTRIYYEKGDIDEFLKNNDPTKSIATWIQVNSPSYQDEDVKWSKLESPKAVALRGLSQEDIERYRPKLDSLARESGYVTGKWMLKYNEDSVVQCWNKIAKCILSGEWGSDLSAKVSSPHTNAAMEEDVYTICVYTANYLDEHRVFEIRQKLKDIEVDKFCTQPLYYKPDLFTMLGTIGKIFNRATWVYIDPY